MEEVRVVWPELTLFHAWVAVEVMGEVDLRPKLQLHVQKWSFAQMTERKTPGPTITVDHVGQSFGQLVCVETACFKSHKVK